MNDLTKYWLKRFLQGFGVRVMKARYYKFEYDKENYPEAAKVPAPIIFDVGANIGQSAVWFSRSFPTAQIHAFEPVPIIFRRLNREVAGIDNIKALNLACGKLSKVTCIPSTASETTQTVQVLATELGVEEGDRITITTVDEYCEVNNISSIQILKTDTEGYDLDVLQGASRMLGAGRICYILSEVTIINGDEQHTNLFRLIEWLKPFGFTLVSLYDLHHDGNTGKLDYFNALFERSV